jgi:hypothetical protein
MQERSDGMISPDELSQIRRENERYLTDELVHLRRSVAQGDYGEEVQTFSTVATWACGFAYSPFKFRSREVLADARTPISEILVRARMPNAARDTIDTDDVVVLTRKFGEPVEHQRFSVQGYEELTVYGFILNLKKTGV